MNIYGDRKQEALMEVATRCEEQGLREEARRWRDCADRYATGESMDGAGTIDTVDVIVEMTIAVVLAVVVIWSLLGVL
ncbi:MAG TPA: hypothetical protein PLR37_08715 [Candidatus Accumulibacter phosphatis]|nr:hypothetical protein [Candidatus Accumulibacter phosphatis]